MGNSARFIDMFSSGEVLASGKLSVGYGRGSARCSPVIEDITLTIEQGRSLCILGKNGSGKSSILKGVVSTLSGIQTGDIDVLSNLVGDSRSLFSQTGSL